MYYLPHAIALRAWLAAGTLAFDEVTIFHLLQQS